MHKLGLIIIAHTAFERVRQVAKYWNDAGCPVVMHIDSNVEKDEFSKLKECLSSHDTIYFCKRHRCEWGSWGLVKASIKACELLLNNHPEIDHIYLSSGSCLPLRPIDELSHYLEEHKSTDFIESATISEVDWTVGGLDLERFKYYFPFSWKKRRKLFDYSVKLQRSLSVSRRIPSDIIPHIGSQWWCLTSKTVRSILEDPNRKRHHKFFKRVWIPDESYFQSLARKHSKRIESQSLTLSKFDYQGKPHVFYDDHLQLLRRSDCFVARKIWSGADKLYEYYLNAGPSENKQAKPNSNKIDRFFDIAAERRLKGRTGLYMQSRFPRLGSEQKLSAAPYFVFQGFSELFNDFETWLSLKTKVRVHGHLYHPDEAQFSGGSSVFKGGLSSSAKLRDRNPQAFLTNLIWNLRNETQCFLYGPGDNPEIAEFFAQDAQATLFIISGAWAIPLFLNTRKIADLRIQASLLQKQESKFLKEWSGHNCIADVKIWTLTDFIAAPVEPLQLILRSLGADDGTRFTDLPQMRDINGFDSFLRDLRNMGMDPHNAGTFDVETKQMTNLKTRRYNVKRDQNGR